MGHLDDRPPKTRHAFARGSSETVTVAVTSRAQSNAVKGTLSLEGTNRVKATIDEYAVDSSSSADSIDITLLLNEFTTIGNIVREALKSLRVVNENFSPKLADEFIVVYLSGVSSLAVPIYAVGYHSQSNIQTQILLSRFQKYEIELRNVTCFVCDADTKRTLALTWKYKGRAIEILDESFIESKIPGLSTLEMDMNGCIQLSDSALAFMKALLH
ncbi:hypothetical protein BC830DRAFT_1172630 [Chytriomyces sp. MP71]|nr:hypothetical protein BC830DRAFT_1172630 [Chytriomyces sp. MP71]